MNQPKKATRHPFPLAGSRSELLLEISATIAAARSQEHSDATKRGIAQAKARRHAALAATENNNESSKGGIRL